MNVNVRLRTPTADPGPPVTERKQNGTVPDEIVPALLLAFAPMHKRAFGVAMGTAVALLLALMTVMALVLPSARAFPLGLLGEYFAGYSVSWPGVIIGALWGFVVGFVAGWFTAFCRNLSLAISTFLIKARAELTQTRDFLDHV